MELDLNSCAACNNNNKVLFSEDYILHTMVLFNIKSQANLTV